MTTDVIATPNTTFCIIPIHSLTRHVGYMGPIPQDILQCFWKYHKIYHEIDLLSRQLSVLHNADIDLIREYTERGHIRSYRPGERIFSQGLPRCYLYILTLGECEYSRVYPEPNKSCPSDDSIEVNLGLTLTPGHFSFMDGCLEEEILFHEEEDDDDQNQDDGNRKKKKLIIKEDRRSDRASPSSLHHLLVVPSTMNYSAIMPINVIGEEISGIFIPSTLLMKNPREGLSRRGNSSLKEIIKPLRMNP